MSVVGFGQSGFFKTYSDFKKGHIEEDLGKFRTFNYFGKRFQAVFQKNGKKKFVSLKRKKAWGMTDGERVFRFDSKKRPCVLIMDGKIVVFGNYTTKFTKNGLEAENIGEHPFYFASGVNDKMIFLSRKKLLKTFDKGTKARKALKKDTGNSLNDVIGFIQDYNAGKYD